MRKEPEFLPEGDCAILIAFGDEISPQVNQRVTAVCNMIRDAKIIGILDMIPAYASLLVQYNPLLVSFESLQKRLKTLIKITPEAASSGKRIVELPVCYGGEFGPDLDRIAHHAGLTRQEVIDLHTASDYLVYMLGFLPGFCYLGGLDPRLHTPRLETPRTHIPAGSVGIGGSQTGIYPLDSPGGWQLMGRTPVRTYDPNQEPPILLQAGDILRFRAITSAEYLRIYELISRKEWKPTISQAGT